MTENQTSAILPRGSTIGIFGGGQLGRMLSLAAARLGYKTHIYCPSADCPASHVSQRQTIADYTDKAALLEFSQSVDVITYEFENIPTEAVVTAATSSPIYPPIEALYTAQDRLTEKTFISEQAGVPVAPFVPVENEFDAKRALKILGGKCVIKTRRLGYDGKGQVIASTEGEAKDGMISLGKVPSIAEAFIPFRREVSIVCARNKNGEANAYPLIENVHQNHILHKSFCPAKDDTGVAKDLALKILTALDYVGVLAVEFFELDDGSYLVNEIAPRVHNSGHWTQDAGCVDQFELHIRAICGWPLGNLVPRYAVEMTNLLGNNINELSAFAKDPNIRLHLYGKAEARAGRKMGHVNRILS